MENWSRFKHDTMNNAFGKSRLPTVVGSVITLLYTLVVMFAPITIPFEFVAYMGPFLGGAVAGGMHGTNAYDGFMYGARAGAYGFVLVALVAMIGSFLFLLDATGQTYFLTSSIVGMIVLFMITPVMGLLGAVGGSVGTLVRRSVVPQQYNPPIR